MIMPEKLAAPKPSGNGARPPMRQDDPLARQRRAQESAAAIRRVAKLKKHIGQSQGLSRQRGSQLAAGEYPLDARARQMIENFARHPKTTPWPIVHDYAQVAAEAAYDHLDDYALLKRLGELRERMRAGYEAGVEVQAIIQLLTERGIA